MIEHLDTYTVAGAFVFFGLLEAALGVYVQRKRRVDDWLIDGISLFQLAVIIKPAIILVAGTAMSWFFPAQRDALAGLPFLLQVLIVMIPDEFSHYWYHRLAHEHAGLWKLHRTHHSSPDYQISLAFRENWLWFVCMPGLWWSASMIHFGLGEAYILSTLIIGTHNVLIHSGLAWDAPLYRSKLFQPFTWLIERLIQLPSTHRAHHGLGEHAAPHGNYGQFIFLWDVLFGTARFPHNTPPERFGIENDTKDPWYSQLWWPVLRPSDPRSDHAWKRK